MRSLAAPSHALRNPHAPVFADLLGGQPVTVR
jgi:hypothetical protein